MTGSERAGIGPVVALQLEDDLAGVSLGRDRGRDRPQGVTWPHHVGGRGHDLDPTSCLGPTRCLGPTPRRAHGCRDPPPDAGDDGESHRERDQTSTNICSIHRVIVAERVFGVKPFSEHMFACWPVAC